MVMTVSGLIEKFRDLKDLEGDLPVVTSKSPVLDSEPQWQEPHPLVIFDQELGRIVTI